MTKDGDYAGVVGRSASGPPGKGETVKEVHRCLILDPAVGTGTFLFEVIREVHKRFSRNKGAWPGYVREHLLPRLFGFELMMAPYAICHMKLGLELRTTGYTFEGDERVGVYLTNTLEEAEEVTRTVWTRAISEEGRAANRVKRELPIMVVLGNPPYSGHSANASERITELKAGQKYDVVTKKGLVTRTAPKGGKNIKERTFIGRLIQDYYYVDGEALGEKNPKWLQDDYVKFIRYGQHRIEQTGAGILAFITNHGYLDNPTFRGMRQQLMKTFSEIYVLDLHGNFKKKEVCPDGTEDKNVFDIQQGVSVGIFVKSPEAHEGEACRVYHMDLWGIRKNKYRWLIEHELKNTGWSEPRPRAPFYLFRPCEVEDSEHYENTAKISDVFPINGWGIATRKDYLLVDFERESLVGKFKDLYQMSPQNAIEKYGIKESPHWDFAKAKAEMSGDIEEHVRSVLFRPFDVRNMYYEKCMIERGDHRFELMKHMSQANVSLITVRRSETALTPAHFFCTKEMSVLHSISSKEGNFTYPLYLYPTPMEGALFSEREGCGWQSGKDGRVPNLDKGFVDSFSERVGLGFVSDGRGDVLRIEEGDRKGRPYKAGGATTFGPEDLFDYIYGVFHSPEYRRRYAEFLKIDFPRVPLPRDCELFRAVARLGGELVGLHLMESDVLDEEGRGPEFEVEGDMTVAKGYPKYDVGEERVYVNEKQYFAGVGEAVWDFHVGGYQVCGKWLKDRRGRVLSYDDVSHYQRIVVALGETIRIMGEIDEAIDGLGGWPIDE